MALIQREYSGEGWSRIRDCPSVCKCASPRPSDHTLIPGAIELDRAFCAARRCPRPRLLVRSPTSPDTIAVVIEPFK